MHRNEPVDQWLLQYTTVTTKSLWLYFQTLHCPCVPDGATIYAQAVYKILELDLVCFASFCTCQWPQHVSLTTFCVICHLCNPYVVMTYETP